MGRELADAIERVRQMCGASGVTSGTIELAVLLLGYRRVAETLLPPAPPGPQPPFAEPLPPATPPVDELYKRLGGQQ